jgi:hypothetical protein
VSDTLGTVERLLDYATDIYLALRGIGLELDAWSQRPVAGRITVSSGGSTTMTVPAPIDIPTDDVPCRVDWQDRLGGDIAHSATDTTWLVVDDTGAPTTVVTVEPDLGDSEEETGTCTFHAGAGLFQLVATTPSGSGTIEARRALYNIVAGAPAVGVITLG